ncbi:MAG: hypothetical protein GY820_47210, partial [Gammaproteobacteria bacterium]|nr:hypothetical protein [Gammaproteobacteria bacterium]
MARLGTEPQEVRAREQFDETRPWREISDLVMNMVDKLSRKPSLAPEIPHLREELGPILDAVRQWGDQQVLPADKLFFDEWVHQVLESVLPFKEASRLIASIDRIVDSYLPNYRVSANDAGAEVPMTQDLTRNRQFGFHLDDRFAYMVLSKKFPAEIPIDHPDFNYTQDQKHFTGEKMTGKDLAMVYMHRREGSYPISGKADDAQRISNLFLLMWGTIPGRLEATEIYHAGNYLEGINELESMIIRNGGHSFVTLSYSKYLGPVGIEQYNTDQFERLLTPQLVQRLRDNNWARPAKITEPWCDYLIIQPLEGYPVVFHLADFG